MLTYGSVCSGIEAASVAWEPLGWRPAFFAEIDAFPAAVLAHHWGSNLPGEPLSKNGVPNHGDFTRIGTDAGPVDLLVGGTPCQSFSVAGKRLGLDDPRGNLALEYVRLAKRTGARWVVWENVPGVLSSADGRDFGDFLGFLAGRSVGVPRGGWRNAGIVAGLPLSYGLAWRVLDAQHVRIDGFARAVPQRRRRVFVVGHLGDWRRAAAVLLEPEGLRGDPPPRREAGQGVAGTIEASLGRRGGQPNDHDPAGGLVAFGGGNGSGPLDVATALTAHGHRIDFEVETFVAHSLRADGFDASEDGTGRGTPLVAVPEVPVYTLAVRGRGDSHDLEFREDGVANAVLTPSGGRAGIGVGAVAFDWQAGGKQTTLGMNAEHTGTLSTEKTPAVMMSGMQVRRLMPSECARLQGFPDDHARIPWKGRPSAQCPDGPQYKAYGNSMAVNVMRWLGRRIDLMERLIAEGRT